VRSGTSLVSTTSREPQHYLYNTTRVAAIIRLEFGISYHPVHVGRLLKAIRWSPQKPVRRARQRDEAAIAHWRQEIWPALKGGRRPRAKASSL
jgi:transposase